MVVLPPFPLQSDFWGPNKRPILFLFYSFFSSFLFWNQMLKTSTLKNNFIYRENLENDHTYQPQKEQKIPEKTLTLPSGNAWHRDNYVNKTNYKSKQNSANSEKVIKSTFWNYGIINFYVMLKNTMEQESRAHCNGICANYKDLMASFLNKNFKRT